MRDAIVAVFFGLLAVGLIVGGWWFVSTRVVSDPQAEAEAAIDAYLDAWERGDAASMLDVVGEPPPEGFVAAHDQLREGLSAEDVRVGRGEVTLQGSQADTDLDVAVRIGDAGTVTWSSTLTAQRIEREWRVLWEPSTVHPDLRAGWTFDVIEEEPARAGILAHDGTPLTAPGELVTVGIEPQRIDDREAFLADISELLPEAAADLEELLARDDLNPDWYYPVVTLRPDRWETVGPDVTAIRGTVVRTEAARVGSDDGFALHTLGRVGPAGEDRAEELGVEPDDVVGLYGLEAALEDRLTGTPAAEVVIRDADGEVRTTLDRFQADPPEPVTTTLDHGVQTALERALVGQTGSIGVVVVDAPSGAIRAVASRPLAGFNRALAGRYPPGSTFKVVTAAAVLAAGTSPGDEVACPGEVVIGGLRLRNAHDLALGTTTLTQAFARSCNTTFADLATDLPADAVGETAARFGFGVAYELPLDSVGGSYPEPQDLAERAAAAIGQGRVEASALHLASVAGAVASGSWRPPYLLAGEGPDDGTDIPAGVRSDLAGLMEAVVREGTGTAAQVEGPEPVAGKTGSAEFGSGDPPPTHAWFIGFRGDLAFAVLVEEGGEGGSVAAPIAARLLRELADA
ncbi:MAG: penicillin-binding protein [Actinobacteria bacterium]|nr:penicillin-binding protein [Actinomycetota bacterium]